MASGAGRSVVIIGIHFFSSSFHSQPKSIGDGNDGLGVLSLFHTSSQSVHEEWPGSTLLMWGEAALILLASW